jgi:hypothetical protein
MLFAVHLALGDAVPVAGALRGDASADCHDDAGLDHDVHHLVDAASWIDGSDVMNAKSVDLG